MRELAKKVLQPFYQILNLFLLPYLHRYYFRKINRISRDTQLFFMTRPDLGTCFLLMHYAQCWQKERGPATLVIFTTHMKKIVEYAKGICPDVQIIHFDNLLSRFLISIFKNELPQHFTFQPVYSYACCRWPHALYLYDRVFSREKNLNVSCYVKQFDPILKEPWPFSDDLLKAYLKFRRVADYRRPVFEDMIRLHHSCLPKIVETPKHPVLDSRELLQRLKIEGFYVVLNVNCKLYKGGGRNNRKIHHPQRYNTLIDFLISHGFSVVIQGRHEQPTFAPRKGLISYAHTQEASPINDLKLCSNSSFGIFNKTGPLNLCMTAGTPVLGLDFVELATTDPNGRSRFFPKFLWDKKKDQYIHWKEALYRPCFYDVGCVYHEEDTVQYVDLTEEELIAAATEFLPLISQPSSQWTDYSPLQLTYKKALHPIHLDQYELLDVPCNAYLGSKKFSA